MAEPTALEDIAALARDHQALNLAQGYPETPGPHDVRAAAATAIMEGPNQYAPVKGQFDFRQAVCDFYARYQRFDLDPDEVLVTSGGTEALSSTILALVKPGDDVLVIEPMYDAYGPLIRRAGGRVIPVRLQPPHWILDIELLRSLVTDKTRALLLSNPANPMARLFGTAELEALARICVEKDLTVIADEVWENIIFDGKTHRPLASFPGMRARTVKIGSAGKILSLTGWKVGFVCAEARLLHEIHRSHQFLTFSTAPHLQTAIAFGLGRDAGTFAAERLALERSRDRLASRLTDQGFSVLPAQSTYFLYIDLVASGIRIADVAFSRMAIIDAQVATIPMSVLYSSPGPSHILRACFARSDETIDEGAVRLAKAKSAC